MSQGIDSDSRQPVAIGPDGFAMFALSAALMLLSLGSSLALAFAYVLGIAWRAPRIVPPSTRIIVLGMRLNAQGEPTPAFHARLDRAWSLWLLAPRSRIIVLGGTTRAGMNSEAGAAAACLRALGVPADQIETEDRSRHTLENLIQYRERYPARQADPSPPLVTSRFHLARSSLLAGGLGIPHTRCAAEDSRLSVLGQLPLVLHEALLVHWYVTGRTFARLTGNKRMAARIT